jgi:gliding motility-associated lipoprotein GldK
MRKLSVFLLGSVIAFTLLTACNSAETGQLIGVQDRPKFKGINPHGMVYIPSGDLIIGQSDQDIFNSHIQRPKSISITGFYMDDTEVTNNEYRQFVHYVRDSIAHTMLDNFYEDEMGNERIDWDMDLDWSSEMLDDFFYSGDEAFAGKRELDTRQLNYTYYWYDWKKAARSPKNSSRSTIIHKDEVNIYPDTLCWIRDFAYSYNEPMTRSYFSHPAYDDYPVVGVNWKQSQAFGFWRTQLWNTYSDNPLTEDFRLPTEYEWEYAARGGHDLSPYPWGGPYLRNKKGCLMANFKPGRGNYPEDGGMYTVRSDRYYPNDLGLYNMAGNASEWTVTAYFDHTRGYEHDLNPDIKYDAKEDDPEVYKRKVIRGGSWKDIGYYLQTSTRDWEYQDTSKSYIGFRNVLSHVGKAQKDLYN